MWQVNVKYNDGKEIKYSYADESEARKMVEAFEQMTIASHVTIISPDR